uniref:Acyl-CoA-delta9-desaturase n=1 Tax=Lampronia capitella TaxID=485574 RepID=B6CBS3_9NEOP|nr:acyl-CoA-delta9-desaturase [Lampronia capitella]
MPPEGLITGVLFESDARTADMAIDAPAPPYAEKRPLKIVWRNTILFVFLHLAGLYGGYLFLTTAMWRTCLFAFVLYLCSGLGITAGAHRLWAHKSYKAKLPLRILLTIFNTIAFQDSVIDWARDHRMHHKYSETDADPHNATRGFFFSHMGWLMVKKHPEIKAKGHTIDHSDLWADPVLRFQKKHYLKLMPLACFILPTYIPTLWGETMWTAFFVCAIFRYTYVLNVTWLVNSAAHKWGDKPYDKNISPVETKPVSLVVLGEGFHNYHHTFPWDYKTAELGHYMFNFSKMFIDFNAMIGWAHDLKTVSRDIVEKRVKRTGDGSHAVWGWDDNNVPIEERNGAIIINPEKSF